MKLSISLAEADVEALDRYAEEAGLESRSAAIQAAIRLLPDATLAASYEDAWAEWVESTDGEAWDRSVGDGLGHVAR